MNFKSLLTVSLATATASVAVPTFSQSATSSEDKVSFSCQEIFDPDSKQIVSATVAWVSQRSENVPVIYWKSELFSRAAWTPQARCEEVTPKFQTFYDSDRLNYLTHGKVGAYPVICATLTNNEETCNQDNFLFSLKNDVDGQTALQKLINIEFRHNGILIDPPIQTVYVDFNKFLLNAPAVEKNASN